MSAQQEPPFPAWLYFGCGTGPGHYLHRPGMATWGIPRRLDKMSHFDAMLCLNDPRQEEGRAVISRLGGWGYTAMAWWDRSEDKRSGCNSIVFAHGLRLTPEEMLAGAHAHFPKVMARQNVPVQVVGGPI